MLNLGSVEWGDLGRQADEALDSLLGWAVEAQFNEWAAASLAVALNPETPAPLLHAAQGEYKAYKRATMILYELRRKANLATEKARKSKENRDVEGQ